MMNTTWFDLHCYGCGEAFTDETLTLRKQIEEQGETPELVTALNASSSKHQACFE